MAEPNELREEKLKIWGNFKMKGVQFMRSVPMMRDGLKLAANIYMPEKSGKYPVIMEA